MRSPYASIALSLEQLEAINVSFDGSGTVGQRLSDGGGKLLRTITCDDFDGWVLAQTGSDDSH